VIVDFDGPNVKQFFEASSTGKVALTKWKFGRQSVGNQLMLHPGIE